MHFRKLLRVQRKRFAFCQLAAAATNETSSRQQHQLRPRCDPLLPPPPPPPCSYSPPFGFRNKNYGNRCVATCRAAACDMVHTRVTLQLSLCLSLALFPSPFACCTPNVEIYVYLYLCSTRTVQKVADSGEYLCYGQCLFYLSYMSRLVFSPLPPSYSSSIELYELSLWWPHSGIYCIFFFPFSSIFSNLINAFLAAADCNGIRVSLVLHVMAFITAFRLTLTIYNFWCILLHS